MEDGGRVNVNMQLARQSRNVGVATSNIVGLDYYGEVSKIGCTGGRNKW
jgi:hypothetical protein